MKREVILTIGYLTFRAPSNMKDETLTHVIRVLSGMVPVTWEGNPADPLRLELQFVYEKEKNTAAPEEDGDL